MKPCTVYRTATGAKAGGVIIGRQVLLPAPRRDDKEPVHVIDGRCYYPPAYAADFAVGMHHNLMPFSTECEWGEYTETDSPVRGFVKCYGGEDYDYEIKWGYCDTETGQIRIPPETQYCGDFNPYGCAVAEAALFGIIETSGHMQEGGYLEIKKTHHDCFLVLKSADGWGALDGEGYELVQPNWYSIEWDGMGGFTVARKKWETGTDVYGIVNSYDRNEVVYSLTEKPVVYHPNTNLARKGIAFDEPFDSERFRLTRRGDFFGLIRDVFVRSDNKTETYSEEILAPVYRYEEISDAVFTALTE
jgi:hypothetical protein